ncbi:MAG: hypothetical protein JWO53_1218 [Chlamydiia bacterium]|nr:hypothetical protein [Chlamydiia bacterium]
MDNHFLFQPGEWLGNGQVSFSMSPDILHFRTRWVILEEGPSFYQGTQTVEIVDGDRIINVFEVTRNDPVAFAITLDNELLGTFAGQGVIEESTVAWEFREKGAFEGFEVYKKIDDTEYSMHAEYLSSDKTRTMIRGKIWKRVENVDYDDKL